MVNQEQAASENLLSRLRRSLRQEILPVIRRLPVYGRLVYQLIKDPAIPTQDKSLLVLVLGYQVSPIDLVPGVIPVIGQLDDLLILLWGIQRTLAKMPPERVDTYLTELNLTREQIDADTAVVTRALRATISQGARLVGRTALGLVKAGIWAGAFVGFSVYYLLKSRKR